MIKIIRNSASVNIFRAYKIFIDGNEAGEIKQNQTIEFPVSAGQHELEAKIDWCGSNKLLVDTANEDVAVEVRAKKLGNSLMDVVLDTKDYLELVEL